MTEQTMSTSAALRGDTRSPFLEVDDVSVTFRQKDDSVHAVRGISYQVNPGEFLGIVGESGSGKSVSSMATMGLLPSNAEVSGEVRLNGRNLLGLSDEEMSQIRGSEIAMVFQDPLSALTPVYTVGKQIEEALFLHDRSLSKTVASKRAVELLDIVGIPGPERRVHSYPHEFSGGMRQRAMIAIAIANNPKLIIADEPTTALDVTIQAQILEVLQEAKRITGAAVILITHDLGVVAGHADRIAVMYAGRLVETGGVEDVFSAPLMPYTAGLLRSVPNMFTAGEQRLFPLEGRPPSLSALPPGCPFAPRCPIAIPACREAEPELRDPSATGRQAACIRSGEIASGELPVATIFPEPEPVTNRGSMSTDAPILKIDGLVRHFPLTRGAVFKRRIGTVKAVDGVSAEIGRGSTLALVGESGCGKSTTAGEIMEMAKPQAGTITIDGVDVAQATRSQRQTARQNVQIVFQDPMAAVDPRLPIIDVIGEPLVIAKTPADDRRRKVIEMLDLVGLDPAMADRYPHEFSGGQRQRIGIARALITDPKLIILDEPVSSLDVSIQAGVINLLEDLRDRLGLSYLFVAHDLAVVRQIADDVAVMYLGRFVEHGPVEELFAAPKHPYTRALMSAVPVPEPEVERSRQRILLEGDLPSPADEISGCNFRTRCPLFQLLDESDRDLCISQDPDNRPIDHTLVACHHSERIGLLDRTKSSTNP